MPKRTSSFDINQIAAQIVGAATEPSNRVSVNEISVKKKNPAAVSLGRLGGLKGGKARDEKLSAKQRQKIAKKAAKARWSKRSKLS
jgi:hypothetical protein